MNEQELPDDIHQGLTHIIWKNLKTKGLVSVDGVFSDNCTRS